jgi:8-oxo-dGTP pyrophosphatase MutT (NUDIX family)
MNKVMSKGVPAIPRPASTVLLLREQSGEFEVFLLRRHQKSVFMAGNYVYPGGTVDKSDNDEDVLTRCVPSPSETGNEAAHSVPDLLGYRIAAIRELFEEAGVLLAYREDGTPFRLFNESERERFLGYRKELNEGRVTLSQLAAQENLLLALDHLFYYTHWITPEANPVRFDTRFFVTRHPNGQEASPDLKETTNGIWITPASALKANIDGSVPLSPPTLKTLEDAAGFDGLGPFLGSLKCSEKRPPVLPVSVVIAEETVLIFPWDPEYEAYRMGKIPSASDASHGRPSGPTDNTTRLVYRKSLWVPFVK